MHLLSSLRISVTQRDKVTMLHSLSAHYITEEYSFRNHIIISTRPYISTKADPRSYYNQRFSCNQSSDQLQLHRKLVAKSKLKRRCLGLSCNLWVKLQKHRRGTCVLRIPRITCIIQTPKNVCRARTVSLVLDHSCYVVPVFWHMYINMSFRCVLHTSILFLRVRTTVLSITGHSIYLRNAWYANRKEQVCFVMSVVENVLFQRFLITNFF